MLEVVVIARPLGGGLRYRGDASAGGGWLMRVGGNLFGDLARVLERDRTRSVSWEQMNPILSWKRQMENGGVQML